MSEIQQPDNLPLSINQARMLFNQWLSFRRYGSWIPLNHRYIVLRLRGSLHKPWLAAAIQALVKRHRILTVKISDVRSPALNVSLPVLARLKSHLEQDRQFAELLAADIPDPLSDMSGPYLFRQSLLDPGRVKLHASGGKQGKKCSFDALVQAAIAREFDFEGPMIRFDLLSPPDLSEYLLVIAAHPFVADGFSMTILARELAIVYAAYSRNIPDPLKQHSSNFWDFVRWERRQSTEGALDLHLDYWKNEAQRASACAVFRPRLPHRGNGAPGPAIREQAVIGDAAAAFIRQFTRRQHLTLYTLLVGCLGICLQRNSSGTTIAIQGTQLNRTHPATMDLVGWFSNNHILLLDLAGDPTVAGFLQSVRNAVLRAYDHQQLPTSMLWGHLGSASVSAIFGFRQSIDTAGWPDEIEAAPLPLYDYGTAPRILEVHVIEQTGSLTVAGRCSSDLMTPVELRNFVVEYVEVIARATANPEKAISDLGETLGGV